MRLAGAHRPLQDEIPSPFNKGAVRQIAPLQGTSSQLWMSGLYGSSFDGCTAVVFGFHLPGALPEGLYGERKLERIADGAVMPSSSGQ